MILIRSPTKTGAGVEKLLVGMHMQTQGHRHTQTRQEVYLIRLLLFVKLVQLRQLQEPREILYTHSRPSTAIPLPIRNEKNWT
jgi:hypothetical protein